MKRLALVSLVFAACGTGTKPSETDVASQQDDLSVPADPAAAPQDSVRPSMTQASSCTVPMALAMPP